MRKPSPRQQATDWGEMNSIAVRTRSRAAGIVAVRLQASATANRVGDTAMVIQPTVLGGSAIKAASIG